MTTSNNSSNSNNQLKDDQFSAQLSAEPNFYVIDGLLSSVSDTDDLEQNAKENKVSKTQANKIQLTKTQSVQPQQKDASVKYNSLQHTTSLQATAPKQSQQTLQEAGDVVASIKQTQIDKYDELESYKRLRKRRTRRLVARMLVFALVMVLLPVTIFLCSIVIDRNGNHNFFGYTYYLVVSSSMEPEIKVNDLVVLKKVKDFSKLKVGDDIGYINADGQVVVHRIVRVDSNYLGETQYYTKGVNNTTNPSQDMLPVGQNQVVGVRVATHHAMGQTLSFFRSAGGIVVLVLLLGVMIGGFVVAFRFTEDIRYVPEVQE